MKQQITQNDLFDMFYYVDGELFWKIRKQNVVENRQAGCYDNKGYQVITINGKVHKAHRLIYLYHYGNIPTYIDHIDGDPKNNRIENLRPCSKSENACNRGKQSNNTSGVKGVSYVKKLNKWRAQCRKDGKNYYLGIFDKIEDAELTVKSFRDTIHKNFSKD